MNLPLWDNGIAGYQWGIVIGASLASAVTDAWARKIPNRITFSLFASGLAWSATVGGISGLFESLAASALLALPFVILFVLARGGAGDAKLMGAIGAWLGLIGGVITLFFVVLCGALCGLGYALWRGRFTGVVARTRALAANWCLIPTSLNRHRSELVPLAPHDQMMSMPYGVAIFAGVCMSAGGIGLWRNML